MRPEPRSHARPAARCAGAESRDLAVRLVARVAVLIGAAFAVYLALTALDDEARARPAQPRPPVPPTAVTVPGSLDEVIASVGPTRQPASAIPQPVVPAVKVPTVKVPAVEVPAVKVPAVKVPAVKVPAVKVPAVKVPAVKVPAVKVPGVELASVEVPGVELASVEVPGVELPSVDVPAVEVPGVALPAVEVPAVQLPGVQVPVPVAPPLTGPGSDGSAPPVVPSGPEPSARPDATDQTDPGPSASADIAGIPAPGAVGFGPAAMAVSAPDTSPARGTGTKTGVKPAGHIGGSEPAPVTPPGLPGRLPHADALAGVSGGAGHPSSAWGVTHSGWRAEVLELGLGVRRPGSGSGRGPDGPSPSG